MAPHLDSFLRSLWHIAGYYETGLHPSVDTCDLHGNTPLHHAIRLGDLLAVELLLAEGADIHASGEDAYTPLHTAVEWRQEQLAQFLVANGANPSTQNVYNQTAFELADLRGIKLQ